MLINCPAKNKTSPTPIIIKILLGWFLTQRSLDILYMINKLIGNNINTILYLLVIRKVS
jgi:hypothetical protein